MKNYVLERKLNGVTSYFTSIKPFNISTTKDINLAVVYPEPLVDTALFFCKTTDKRVWNKVEVSVNIRRAA